MKKYQKSLLKFFTVIVVVQIVIACLSFVLIQGDLPVDKADTKQITIIVDDKYRPLHSRYYFIILDDYVGYWFPPRNSLYSIGELEKEINIGDEITLLYAEENSLFGKRNVVYEAYTDNVTYRSLEEENKDRATNGGFWCSFFLEILFLLIAVPCSIIAVKIEKPTKKPRKRKSGQSGQSAPSSTNYNRR